MNQPDETGQEIEALRARISRLSAAILRISVSLDPATVLQEVVDSARALTGARYGIITTVDGAGQPQDLVTSGFTAHEHAQLAAWPDDVPAPPRPSATPSRSRVALHPLCRGAPHRPT